MVEYKSVRCSLPCGGSCYVSFPDAVYGAVVEIGRSPAENEIDRAFYVALFVILADVPVFPVWVKGVLESAEGAAVEYGAVAVYEGGYGLPHGAGGVGKGDILGVEVIAIDIAGGRARCTHRLAQRIFWA